MSRTTTISIDELPVVRNIRIGRQPREYEFAGITRRHADGKASAAVSVLGRSQSGKTIYVRELKPHRGTKCIYFSHGASLNIPRSAIVEYYSYSRQRERSL
ncbi:MAG TPA: hypothetical protein VJK52_03565 [Candidatus Nanoarchaeia archaeon]|nr:hypothetical protein [Candidatus Nanoarchaeia archaeon]